ncbi:transcription elongation factor GreA [Candidatus Uhrbacteria bacterium]|jgi:transcription elongation factor GreA|nr:transcription elongation factor GreA [Candidatus Uhrbacteria bacterium]
MPVYLSQNAIDELKVELVKRTKVTRVAITAQIGAAIELGDLSENFEYHDAKERQGLNEARVSQIEAMLVDAVIVETAVGAEEITLGVNFTVMINDTEKSFSIVGSSEADPMSGKISNESPTGQAFLGKKVDEVVEITVPSGVMVYTIIAIA